MRYINGKVNLYRVMDELLDIKDSIKNEGMLNRINNFRPIDYTDWIETDLKGLEMAWKYNGIYYKNPSNLFNMAENKGYKNAQRAFIIMLKDPNRQLEMWEYEIQLIFMSKVGNVPYYITCDGQLLTNQKLTKIKGNPYNSSGFITIDGEKIIFNKAVTVWTYFMDYNTEYDAKDILYLDGFYGNCGLDNIEIKDIKNGQEVDIINRGDV